MILLLKFTSEVSFIVISEVRLSILTQCLARTGQYQFIVSCNFIAPSQTNLPFVGQVVDNCVCAVDCHHYYLLLADHNNQLEVHTGQVTYERVDCRVLGVVQDQAAAG